MFDYDTLWDVYEIKFIILCVSIVIAIWLGNKFYDRRNKK
jgi:hypothetical protein